MVNQWVNQLKKIIADLYKIEQEPEIELSNELSFGDYTTQVAFRLSKMVKKSPQAVAQELAARIKTEDFAGVDKVEPMNGYINFFLSRNFLVQLARQVHKAGPNFGGSEIGRGIKINLEYCSANPVGPLTIASARQAAIGDCLSKILRFLGYEVTREYYINDCGRQVDLLGESVFARYCELKGAPVAFPPDGYHGDYIMQIAEELLNKYGDLLLEQKRESAIETCKIFAMQRMTQEIKEDLEEFRVNFDVFYSQDELEKSGKVEDTVNIFKDKELAYDKDGAVWLSSTLLGDDKDRVIVKSDGTFHYRAADVAYHKDKFDRGFDRLMVLLGPDHHAHVIFMKKALQAMDFDIGNRYQALIIQHCRLLRGQEEVKMSKRLATYVTLKELLDEVGVDAARFFFLMRRAESHLDFDLEIAKKKSLDNPVYYVQYAHARINSIMRKGVEQGLIREPDLTDGLYKKEADLSIVSRDELGLLRMINRFPSEVALAARTPDTACITTYLHELSGLFQTYYQKGDRDKKFRVLTEDESLRNARLYIISALQIVLRNGLNLLAIGCPASM